MADDLIVNLKVTGATDLVNTIAALRANPNIKISLDILHLDKLRSINSLLGKTSKISLDLDIQNFAKVENVIKGLNTKLNLTIDTSAAVANIQGFSRIIRGLQNQLNGLQLPGGGGGGQGQPPSGGGGPRNPRVSAMGLYAEDTRYRIAGDQTPLNSGQITTSNLVRAIAGTQGQLVGPSMRSIRARAIEQRALNAPSLTDIKNAPEINRLLANNQMDFPTANAFYARAIADSNNPFLANKLSSLRDRGFNTYNNRVLKEQSQDTKLASQYIGSVPIGTIRSQVLSQRASQLIDLQRVKGLNNASFEEGVRLPQLIKEANQFPLEKVFEGSLGVVGKRGGSLSPGNQLAFQKAVSNQKGFDLSRLGSQEALTQLGFAGLFGGIPGLTGAAIGGAVGGAPGVFLGSALSQGVVGLTAQKFEEVVEVLKKVVEAGLEFQKSLLGISGILQATTSIKGANGQLLSPQDSLLFNYQRSREFQTAARARLLPIGISGTTEAAIVQATVAGEAQSGKVPTPQGVATLAQRIGAAITAINPSILQNESQLRRDIEGVFRSGGQRSLLTGILGPQLTSQIRNAKTEDDVLKVTKSLDAFVEVLTKLGTASIGLAKLNAALNNLQTNVGDKLLTSFSKPLNRFADDLLTLSNKASSSSRLEKLFNLFSGFTNKLIDIGEEAFSPQGRKSSQGIFGALGINSGPANDFILSLLDSVPLQKTKSIAGTAIANPQQQINEILTRLGVKPEDQEKFILGQPGSKISNIGKLRDILDENPQFKNDLGTLPDRLVFEAQQGRLEQDLSGLGNRTFADRAGRARLTTEFYDSTLIPTAKASQQNALQILNTARYGGNEEEIEAANNQYIAATSLLNETLKKRDDSEQATLDASKSYTASLRGLRDSKKALDDANFNLPLRQRSIDRSLRTNEIDIRDNDRQKRLLDIDQQEFPLQLHNLGDAFAENVRASLDLVLAQKENTREFISNNQALKDFKGNLENSFESAEEQLLNQAKKVKELGGDIPEELNLSDTQREAFTKHLEEIRLKGLYTSLTGKTYFSSIDGTNPHIISRTNSPLAKKLKNDQEGLQDQTQKLRISFYALSDAFFTNRVKFLDLGLQAEKLNIQIEAMPDNFKKNAIQLEALTDNAISLNKELKDLPLTVTHAQEAYDDNLRAFINAGGELTQAIKDLISNIKKAIYQKSPDDANTITVPPLPPGMKPFDPGTNPYWDQGEDSSGGSSAGGSSAGGSSAGGNNTTNTPRRQNDYGNSEGFKNIKGKSSSNPIRDFKKWLRGGSAGGNIKNSDGTSYMGKLDSNGYPIDANKKAETLPNGTTIYKNLKLKPDNSWSKEDLNPQHSGHLPPVPSNIIRDVKKWLRGGNYTGGDLSVPIGSPTTLDASSSGLDPGQFRIGDKVYSGAGFNSENGSFTIGSKDSYGNEDDFGSGLDSGSFRIGDKVFNGSDFGSPNVNIPKITLPNNLIPGQGLVNPSSTSNPAAVGGPNNSTSSTTSTPSLDQRLNSIENLISTLPAQFQIAMIASLNTV